MKNNKRFLQFIAALFILVFHTWVPVSKLVAEQFLTKAGYVGVDIFFFLSAYSLADKQIDYTKLLKNRFATLYSKFLIFVIVAAFYKRFSLIKVVKSLTMLEFFEKGGGAFLWFVPAILIFYLIYPLFVKWKLKYKVVIVLLAWFVICAGLQYGLGYTDIFIFLHRIPVMLLGYVVKKHKLPVWTAWVSLPVGVALMYCLGFTSRLNVPLKEIYFVFGAFITLGISGISGYIKPSKVWDILGMGTLELYGLQMIFGMKFANYMYKITRNALATNLVVIVVLFVAAIILAKLFEIVTNVITKKFNNPKAV